MGYKLTPREYEIFTLLAHGLRVKDVAVRLHLSHQTVKNAIGDGYRRLGVRTRYQAFLELGWLTPPEIR